MRIALINGSPKGSNSASEALLAALTEKLGDEHEIISLRLDEDSGAMKDASAIVLAFPLYVDALPAYLAAYLESLESLLKEKNVDTKLYTLVNCGFFEPEQCALAIKILRRYCEKNGLIWGQALAMGGGPMIGGMPIGNGPLTRIGQGLDVLAVHILLGESGEDEYVRPNFPRRLYWVFGNASWKRQAKKNGLPKRALYDRP